MKLLSTFAAVLLGCSSVLARPLEERQNGITYLQAKTNIASRYEIRQLRDEYPNQYTLFVLAMNKWMGQSQSSATSYFGIASIHGVPHADYNGANGNNKNCGSGCSGADGYAVHDSVLFPAWHRAYLGLFEQEMTKVAKEIAGEYPSAQRATMQKAANALRLPYYDAGAMPKAGSPAFPNLMTDVRITVNGPTGKKTFTNPLFRYDIADPSGFYYQYFTTWTRTLRYPNTNAADAASNSGSVHNAMTNLRQSVSDQFYGLFTNCHAWLQFSNDRAGSSAPGCATSMEDVHNGIHTAIGGAGGNGVSGGHMYYLPISSFDPAFWLHHSNIDRIFAMWQTLNPNAWGDSQSTPTASWTVGLGEVVNADSILTPFMRKTGGNNGFWTSNGVRNFKNLGYTYPEYKTGGSAQQITQYINQLYGSGANTPAGGIGKRDIFGDIADSVESVGQNVESTVQDTVQAATSSTDSTDNPITSLVDKVVSDVNSTLTGLTNTAQGLADPPIKIGSPLVAQNGSLYQYVANIFTPRYTLDGSYQVYLFDGKPATEDTAQWVFQDNLIGMMGVLSKPGMTSNPLIASGSIPLTRTLQKLVPSTLSDLSEDVVVPYLTTNLVWKIAGPNGEIEPSTIDGFVVSLYSSTAPQVADTQLPTWSEFIPLLDATKDQSGGANTTAQLAPPVESLVASIIPSYSS